MFLEDLVISLTILTMLKIAGLGYNTITATVHWALNRTCWDYFPVDPSCSSQQQPRQDWPLVLSSTEIAFSTGNFGDCFRATSTGSPSSKKRLKLHLDALCMSPKLLVYPCYVPPCCLFHFRLSTEVSPLFFLELVLATHFWIKYGEIFQLKEILGS